MSTAKLAKKAKASQWEKATGFKGFIYYNRYILLSFAVPFIIMTVAFGLLGTSPVGFIKDIVDNIGAVFTGNPTKPVTTGDKQILVTDLWHQYFPFLADYQEKLKAGESLFWTWSVGSGVNFFALASYYLASPMNFLSVFIPADWLNEFLMFSVVTKLALAGMFMAIFLRYTFKRNDYSLLLFSVCFAVCAFFMGYYWNTIWLDTVALTPLVAMGTVALLREGKFKLYVIALALSLLANYYVGFFTCIFVLLFYIGYSICKWQGTKKFFISLGKMAGFSAMGIALTAFLLLPAYMALGNAHASASTFPKTYAINIGATADLAGTLDAVRQIFTNTLSFIEPNCKEADALPNIACGTIAIVLGIVFLANKKIMLREKLFNSCLLLFLVISCVIRQLDYIWHGFHFTNMIPYRFSYLFSFVLITMAFRAFMVIDFANYLDVVLATLGTLVIILLSIGTQPIHAIVGTAIIAGLILIVLFFYTMRFIPKSVMATVLIIVVLAESAATGYIGVKTTTVTTTNDYPRGGENTAYALNYIESLEANTTELYRTECTSTQTLNDGALNHYNGISMFNSMANECSTIFYENFGLMGWQSGNRFTYAENSPVTDLFFNLKYLIARDSVYRNSYTYKEMFTSGNVKLLQNQKYIPMGFMVNKNLQYWSVSTAEDTYNPFANQNAFFKLATGLTDDVYTFMQVTTQSHTDYKQFPVNKLSYGNYSYSSVDASISPHLQWNYNIEEDGYYFVYAYIYPGGENVIIKKNEVQNGTGYYARRPYIMSAGFYGKGDILSVCSDLTAGSSGSAQVYVAKLNQDVFEEGYNILNQHYMTTTSYTDSSMEGTIDAGEGGLFYTSIPYEKGWTATVDGEPVNIIPIGNCMLAFELAPGEHTIKLSYIPNGFIPGIIVSGLALAAFIVAIVLHKRYCKRKNQMEIEKYLETAKTSVSNSKKYNK